MPEISFVFPVYNEEKNIHPLYENVKKVCSQINISYEMIFVDNGSSDLSLHEVKQLETHDSRVFHLSLSRNFGHQNALFAGMSHASGNAVITMDADLQHPPALVPEMIKKWREGSDVVYTIKRYSNLPILKLIFVKLYYWIISKISGLKLNFGQSDFRLIDHRVLKVLLHMPEYHKFLRGQVSWIGFNQVGISFDVQKRHSGDTKFSLKNLFSFGLDGILSFSQYPLRLVTFFGFTIAVISIIYMIYDVLIPYFLKATNINPHITIPPGWATMAVTLFFFGSVQLMSIGILGEYIGRIFDQTKARPNFIVKEHNVPQ